MRKRAKKPRRMGSKEKPFLLAVLTMLVMLWMCFCYVRVGSSGKRKSLSFDSTSFNPRSFSGNELFGMGARSSQRHSPQSRHTLAQQNLYKDLSDEQEHSHPQAKTFEVFEKNRDGGRERRTPAGKSVSDGNGDGWNEELEQLTEDLLGEVLEELKKVQNVTRVKSTPGDTSIQALSEETSDSRCGVTKDNRTRQNRLKVFGQALHSFVLFSSRRFSINEFVVVGLVSVHLREKHGNPISSCIWLPEKQINEGLVKVDDILLHLTNDSVEQIGSANVYYVNETSGSHYDVIVCKCIFEDPVGANAGGGFLYLNTTSPTGASHHIQVLRELPDEFLSIPFEGPFQSEYAFCSPPIWGKLHPKHVKEWLMYHHHVWEGKVHYFMYDAGGIDSEVLAIFQPLIAEDLMTVVDIVEAGKFPSFYHGQHLAINDCLQRSRFVAKWAFFWDLDEYLQILPPTTLSGIVAENENALWISFGHLVWSKTYCVPEDKTGQWAVERMAFHLEYPTCGDKMRSSTCHGSWGLRKWAANPRAVFVATVHRTIEPEWLGCVFNASVARINHYSGLVSSNDESNCLLVKNLDEVMDAVALDGWWWKDTTMSQNSEIARISSQSLHIFNSSLSVEADQRARS